MGVTIYKWISGLLKNRNPASPDFPIDGWQDCKNVIPMESEVRVRPGSTLWMNTQAEIGLEFHSSVTYDGGNVDYIIQHWDTNVWACSKVYGKVLILSGVANAKSSLFQIGKHLFLGIDAPDSNYILSFDEVTKVWSGRLCGCKEFSGTYLGTVGLSAINPGTGNLVAGEYRYMFTFAIYKNGIMVSEGSGFDELKYEKTITLASASNVYINLGDLLTRPNIPGYITHINVYRSLNTSDMWNKDEVYNDNFKVTPIYPWFRFLKACVIPEDGAQIIFTDKKSDDDLKLVYDTYDTRGWKPVTRMSHGFCAPNGRVFWFDSDKPGRVKWTTNAISSNRDVTKYYEHYNEGMNHYYDLNTNSEQNDRGFDLSPLGDLMMFQDTRMFIFRNCDPLRVNYNDETEGYPASMLDSSHGCLNIRANAHGPDGRLYVLGNGGYRGFNGSKYDTPNFLEPAEIPTITSNTIAACVFYGTKFRDQKRRPMYNIVMLSYPMDESNDEPDGCIALVFTNSGVVVTLFEGFSMLWGGSLPTTGELVIVDQVSNDLFNMFTGFFDRENSTDKDSVKWMVHLRDFESDKGRYVILDYVEISSRNLHGDIELVRVSDDIELDPVVVNPLLEGSQGFKNKPNGITNIRKYFDDQGLGSAISLKIKGKSRVPIDIESITLNFLEGGLI